MTDAGTSGPIEGAEPPHGLEPASSAAPSAADASPPPSQTDHHGLIAFFGVLALVLLLVGSVVAGATSGPAPRGGPMDMAPGPGPAFGQERRMDQRQLRLERMAERMAERMRRQAERLERQRLRRELQEQRRGAGGPGTDETAIVTEQTGTVVTEAQADGSTAYLLETATGRLELEVGPPRFWGEAHPLAPFVGQTVTVTGVQEPDTTAFDVYAIGDQVIRGPGRPPWAGGWKADGQRAPTTSSVPTPVPSPSPAP